MRQIESEIELNAGNSRIYGDGKNRRNLQNNVRNEAFKGLGVLLSDEG